MSLNSLVELIQLEMDYENHFGDNFHLGSFGDFDNLDRIDVNIPLEGLEDPSDQSRKGGLVQRIRSGSKRDGDRTEVP